MLRPLETGSSAGAATAFFANPSSLLLLTGAFVGLKFPLGKIAALAGVSPVLWAMIPSLGVAASLFPLLAARGLLHLPERRVAQYAAISGVISFVLPNVLLYAVIPRTGAGYMGLMFALSPVFTLVLSSLFRLKAPNRLGLLGIALGLAGAALVSVTRGAAPDAPPLVWILAGLAVPMALACGNVYRSLAWPDGASPDALAFWSHGAAIVVFVSLLFALDGDIPAAPLLDVPLVALIHAGAAALAFPLYFRLQKLGGPVLLSQIGYVAAAVGLVAATAVLGEQYSPATWAGAAVIAAGIAATITAQRRS